MRCGCRPGRCLLLPGGGAVAAVRGFQAHRPRATRVSAPGGDGFRPRSAPDQARYGSPYGPAQTRSGRTALTRCSLVRPTRVARSGTQIIYVRRILLGHSLPSPAGTTAHPRQHHPEQRERGSSLSKDCRFASGLGGLLCFTAQRRITTTP
ncbi:hypothetical protein LK07_06815 [Streptomyces pluripotens]|uniref:Uncharacterized protein n=1 Tax=Streptomyces pluripotens TaxID=1355015 RepID=A0A221NW66_9ACTN|nr:hypothetical protein LK07_06815 [Streptomyces pluripotens]